MEIRATKANLFRAISLVGSVTASKANTLPILSNLLIESVGKEALCLVGTDLEVGISITIPADIDKEGSITVPSRKILEIIREVPEGEVNISVAKNNAVSIKAGKAYFKIMGLSKEDYPKLPEVNTENAVELEQSLLKDALMLTAFAISSDETRYVLNGVLISVKGETIRFVATDGRRLAYIEKKLPKKASKGFEIIVPAKAIHELQKILTWEGAIKVIPSQNQVIFHFGEIYLVSRLIEGNFPNYEQVIPKEEKTTASANREELLQAVRRTALLTSTDAPAVKMDFLKGKMIISSRSPNMGEAKEELAADINGNELVIGFNPNYLVDVLKNLDVEKISISLSEADKPGLVKGKEGYFYVVMPMQLT